MKINNNSASVTGIFTSDFVYNHEIFGEKFYIADLSVERFSGNVDIIPVMTSERLLNVQDSIDRAVKIEGQFRSYNLHAEGKNKISYFLFAREIEFLDGYVVSADNNIIHLDGYVCKEPVYRETPLGQREIADMLIAVNRSYGKSDYIHCICWGRNARFASALEIGTHIAVDGRIQSREYTKKLENGEIETRTAYEVSVSKLEVLEGEE